MYIKTYKPTRSDYGQFYERNKAVILTILAVVAVVVAIVVAIKVGVVGAISKFLTTTLPKFFSKWVVQPINTYIVQPINTYIVQPIKPLYNYLKNQQPLVQLDEYLYAKNWIPTESFLGSIPFIGDMTYLSIIGSTSTTIYSMNRDHLHKFQNEQHHIREKSLLLWYIYTQKQGGECKI